LAGRFPKSQNDFACEVKTRGRRWSARAELGREARSRLGRRRPAGRRDRPTHETAEAAVVERPGDAPKGEATTGSTDAPRRLRRGDEARHVGVSEQELDGGGETGGVVLIEAGFEGAVEIEDAEQVVVLEKGDDDFGA